MADEGSEQFSSSAIERYSVAFFLVFFLHLSASFC